MNTNQSRTIMCEVVNNVLVPSPTGSVPAVANYQYLPDGTKTASLIFGGIIQGFVTYGMTGDRPIGYNVSTDDPMGSISRSFDNLLQFM